MREASGMGVGKHTPTDRTCNRIHCQQVHTVCMCVFGETCLRKNKLIVLHAQDGKYSRTIQEACTLALTVGGGGC